MKTLARSIIGFGVVLVMALPLAGEAGGPLATTPQFAFYSDFETNLHDALLVAGASRQRERRELFQDDSDAASCFGRLAPSARTAWNLAVDYYAKVVSPKSWMSRQQVLPRFALIGHDDDFDDGDRRFVSIAVGLRQAAGPAYEACYWPRQDAENRRWLEKLSPQLQAHQVALMERLEELYQNPLPEEPVRIDLVGHAPPVGANTLVSPAHVLIASRTADRDAFEITFHEASHILMERSDPMQVALKKAAEEADVELPRDLWHVVQFFTTGEAVKEVLAAAGEPGYVPYMEHHGMWNRFWGKFREAVEGTWPAYLRGERSLDQASADLIAALPPAADD